MSYQQPVAPVPAHPRATTSLVLGILSLVCLGFITGIPAIIIGRRATREIRESHGKLGGEGIASAGFITGLIGTVLSALGFLLVIGLVVLSMAAGTVEQSYVDSCSQVTQGGQVTPCAD